MSLSSPDKSSAPVAAPRTSQPAGTAESPRKRELSLLTFAALILAADTMLWLAFPPLGVWPLALFALAPLSLAVLGRTFRKGAWLLIWSAGIVYFLVASSWLIPVTVGGYIGLSIYMGFYFPVFALLLRMWVFKLKIPPTLAVPLAFTAAEYVRSTLMSGFSWFMVGTALAANKPLLQCADLFGVSGLTFLCGLTAGALVELLHRGDDPKSPQSRRIPVRPILALVLLALATVYGGYRLTQPHVLSPGPLVAVIESRIPQSLKDNQTPADEQAMFDRFVAQSQKALRSHPGINLIAWPETMVPGDLNRSWLAMAADDFLPGHGRGELSRDHGYAKALAALARRSGASLLVGSGGIHFGPDGRPDKLQNIAVYFTPQHGLTGHPYAKHHLVPFGEYIPFQQAGSLFHKWLMYLTPYGPQGAYSLTPGKKWRRFSLHVRRHHWKFGTPICYEDAMPHPCRMFARPRNGKKGVNFLVSISNDGWYASRAELLQHLQLTEVRAVENRVSIARSVNGGDSAIINSDGSIIKRVRAPAGGWKHQVQGYAVARLPLDSRITLFDRIGDLPVRALVLLNLLAVLGVWMQGLGRLLHRIRKKTAKQA